VSLTDTLPPGPTGSDVAWSVNTQPTGHTCSVTSGTLSCASLGDLASGASLTIHVRSATSYADCGSYANTATASAANHPDASNDLASGDTTSIHHTSSTTKSSCTSYANTVTVSASNHPDVVKSASIEVQCPHLSITKTAVASPVDAGDQIGFDLTVSNASAT